MKTRKEMKIDDAASVPTINYFRMACLNLNGKHLRGSSNILFTIAIFFL